MKLKTPSTQYRWFWPLILTCALIRLGLSLYLLNNCHYFFTLSADDVARYRLALLWAYDASFFPDLTWPPFPFWLGGFFIRFFSAGPAVLCAISIATSILTLPLLALLCLGLIPPSDSGRFRNQWLPVTVVLAAFTLNPQWIWLGTSMLAESLYIFLIILTFTAFILAVERKSIRWAFASLIGAVLASMTRLEGVALAGIIFLLLVWRFRRLPSRVSWAALLGFGFILISFFPIAWYLAHSGSAGNLSYLSALKEGFTSQYGHSPFRTPMQLLRMYVNVLPLTLFLILVGYSGVWQEQKNSGMRIILQYQFILIFLYIAAQCLAAALGMMPTHNFWRLTVPMFVLLLPYVGVAFAMLGRFLSVRSQLLPAALCVFSAFPSFPHPPIFVTPDLYQSAVDIREIIAQQPERGGALIEVVGWEWLALSVLGHGPYFDGLLFDRDPQNREASNLNPPIFNLPPDQLTNYLKINHVALVAANSLTAKQAMMSLGWKTVRSGRYALFVPPEP